MVRSKRIYPVRIRTPWLIAEKVEETKSRGGWLCLKVIDATSKGINRLRVEGIAAIIYSINCPVEKLRLTFNRERLLRLAAVIWAWNDHRWLWKLSNCSSTLEFCLVLRRIGKRELWCLEDQIDNSDWRNCCQNHLEDVTTLRRIPQSRSDPSTTVKIDS